MPNNGLEFDLLGQAQFPNLNITGDWSISLWAYAYTTGRSVYFPFGADSSTDKGLFIEYAVANKWGFYDGSTIILANTAININTWYHYVVTKSGTNYLYYLNGSPDGSATLLDVDLLDVRVGNRGSGVWPMEGIVDEVVVWPEVLTPANITTLYNAGAGLYTQAGWGGAETYKLLCHLDETSGLSVPDSSGLGNDGLLNVAQNWVPGWVQGPLAGNPWYYYNQLRTAQCGLM